MVELLMTLSFPGLKFILADYIKTWLSGGYYSGDGKDYSHNQKLFKVTVNIKLALKTSGASNGFKILLLGYGS